MTGLEFRRALKTSLKNRFTSVGCYPVVLVLTDGACLCWKCAHAEKVNICHGAMTLDRGGWEPAAVDVNWEDPLLFCDNCSERIESAYAEG